MISSTRCYAYGAQNLILLCLFLMAGLGKQNIESIHLRYFYSIVSCIVYKSKKGSTSNVTCLCWGAFKPLGNDLLSPKIGFKWFPFCRLANVSVCFWIQELISSYTEYHQLQSFFIILQQLCSW